MYVMTRYMGILLGMALSSTIVQGNLKILLRERIDGDDADKVDGTTRLLYHTHKAAL